MGSISKKSLEKLLKKLGQGKLDVNTTRRLLGLDQFAADPKPTFSQVGLVLNIKNRLETLGLVGLYIKNMLTF